MSKVNNGGPAFPNMPANVDNVSDWDEGMSLRDYFASNMQADDRLVKAVRAMDDKDLAIFANHPDAEREAWEADSDYTGMERAEAITKRLSVEARAIARVRYMQADAMLVERERRKG